VDRVWEESNRRLAERAPDLDRELEAASAEQERVLGTIDRYIEAFESGANPQRRHLLHQMVKEVRVHGRLSVEVTYFVPQPDPSGSPVRTQPHMAPLPLLISNSADEQERGDCVAATRLDSAARSIAFLSGSRES
jgi:hypothetical protein